MKLRVMPAAAALALVMFAACNNNNNDNNAINSNDKTYVTMAAMSNFAEISAAKLADSVSTDANIKDFALKMITDHSKAQDSLKLIAGQLGLYAPDSLDAAHVQAAAMLRTMTGRAFDSAYVHGQVTDHQSAVALFQSEATNGNNPTVKGYEAQYIDVIQMHLMMADSLAMKY